MLDNGPARLAGAAARATIWTATRSRWSARSCSPPPTATGWPRATSTVDLRGRRLASRGASRAGCRSAASPPAGSRSNLPDRRVVLSGRAALAYRPGRRSDERREPPSSPSPARCRCSPSPARARPGRRSALKGHDTNAPVDVAADRIEVQDRADRAIFSGNVEVRQGNLQLSAARLTVAYANAGGIEIERLEASGGVTLRSPSETARSQFAIYDLDRAAGDDDRRRHPDPRRNRTSRAAGWCSTSTAAAR